MSRLIFPYIPQDEMLLVQVGRMAIAHSQLDFALMMLMKSLDGLTVSDAHDKLGRIAFSVRLDKIRKTLKCRYTDFTAEDEIEGYLKQANELNDKRNDIIHGLWAQELDGDTKIIRHADKRELAIPDKETLKEAIDQMIGLTRDIHHSRLQGSISLAIKNSQVVSQ